MVERFGFRVVPIHPGVVTSDYGVHKVGVTICGVQHVLGVWVRPRNQIVLSLSLQWKSDKRTKHYFTQMLLAINWCYWQVGKNSGMHMKVQGHLMQACLIETITKKKSYFSNKSCTLMKLRSEGSRVQCQTLPFEKQRQAGKLGR